MPGDKDSLRFEDVFCLDQVLREVFSVVADFSPHVVDEEWLAEVEFVVGVGHGLEVERHHRARLHISEFVATHGRVHVSVEEFGEGLAILREHRVIEALLPLLIEVNHVVRLHVEQRAQLFVFEDLIENPDLVDGWLTGSVSDSCGGCQGCKGKVKFPDRGLGQHHERETHVADEAAGPRVI